MYRVLRNGFRKMSILLVNFTTEDGICDPETILMISQNKGMVKIKTVVIIPRLVSKYFYKNVVFYLTIFSSLIYSKHLKSFSALFNFFSRNS